MIRKQNCNNSKTSDDGKNEKTVICVCLNLGNMETEHSMTVNAYIDKKNWPLQNINFYSGIGQDSAKKHKTENV